MPKTALEDQLLESKVLVCGFDCEITLVEAVNIRGMCNPVLNVLFLCCSHAIFANLFLTPVFDERSTLVA